MAGALVRTWRVRPAHAVVVYSGLTVVSLLFGAFVTVVARSPL